MYCVKRTGGSMARYAEILGENSNVSLYSMPACADNIVDKRWKPVELYRLILATIKHRLEANVAA